MTVQLDTPLRPAHSNRNDLDVLTVDAEPRPALDDWDDLDVSIIEAGPEADRLIQMTDDGCTSTCASACPASGC